MELSRNRKRFLLGIAIAQLVMVASGAAYLTFGKWGWPGKALELYGKISGADSSYGFFAPGVGTQVRAVFDIIDRAGHIQQLTLDSGHSHEADLRLNSVAGEFTSEADQRFRRSLAASLAGTVFGRHPEAAQVVVRLQEYTPVSMAEYRHGKRADWKPLYLARFVPSPRPTAER